MKKTEVKSPAEILYGDARKKEKQEEEYRSNLLNVLGDLATPVMIMYATNKQLENEIKKNGLIGLGIDNNFHNAIGKADFRNIYQDKDGNLHIKMYDTYDFNKDEDNAFKSRCRPNGKMKSKTIFLVYMI